MPIYRGLYRVRTRRRRLETPSPPVCPLNRIYGSRAISSLPHAPVLMGTEVPHGGKNPKRRIHGSPGLIYVLRRPRGAVAFPERASGAHTTGSPACTHARCYRPLAVRRVGSTQYIMFENVRGGQHGQGETVSTLQCTEEEEPGSTDVKLGEKSVPSNNTTSIQGPLGTTPAGRAFTQNEVQGTDGRAYGVRRRII